MTLAPQRPQTAPEDDSSRTARGDVGTEQLTGLGSALLTAFDGPFATQRNRARAAFPSEGMLRAPDLDLHQARQWTLERLRTLAGAGFGATGIPTSAQEPSDPLGAVLTFELLSYGDLSVTIKSGVQFGLFGGALTNLGTAWHHDTYLADITSLRLLGCFAMTELGHGSDVASLETTISYDRLRDEFVVDSPRPEATKAYIGNAAVDGRMAAVFGQLIVAGVNHGVHVVLVELRDETGQVLPGVRIADQGHKGGLAGVDNGTISFDQVRVPRRMLLDRYGGVGADGRYTSPIENSNRRFFTMLGTLVRGRVCVAGGGGVAARRALSIAARHALARRQFPAPGRPDGVLLADYLTHQRRLLPLIARAYAFGFAQNELIATLVRLQSVEGDPDPREQRELETRAAGIKAATTWFANGAVQAAREACGGAGYLWENQLVGLRGDVDIFATFEGDNTVLMQLVTKALLTDYRQAWGDLDRGQVAQATARAIGEIVVERSAAGLLVDRLVASVRRRPEETTLVDRGWHAWAFEERERHSLESLARRMQAASRSKRDSFEAFNRLGEHVQFVAKAHLERVLLEAFIAGIDACDDPEARAVLERLCSLFALSSISADRAWFLEHSRISAGRAKAIGEQLNALCRELRPHLLPLTEGMGIPLEWLGAPIAQG